MANIMFFTLKEHVNELESLGEIFFSVVKNKREKTKLTETCNRCFSVRFLFL